MMRNWRFDLLRSVVLLSIIIQVISCHTNKGVPPANDADLIHVLNDRLTNVIMQDGFTPPVASRIYAYSNIAAYEASITGTGEYQSIAHQLNGLDSLPSAPKRNLIDKRIALVCAFTIVANSIVYRDSILQNLCDSFVDIYSVAIKDESIVKNSIEYAKQLSAAIINWSNKDGYAETRKMAVFTPGHRLSDWQPTPPKYTDAIEPYWGSLRTFVLDSAAQYSSPLDIPFDTTKGSAFYNMNVEVYEAILKRDSVQMMIARFWDDNPLIVLSKKHTMYNYRQISPGGHWINIAKIVSVQKKLNLQQSCDVYMRVSLALADAFIACWHTKFITNLIRPVTYINQYIDAGWKPLLETPPFPEYTCGHSTISAGASQVLANYFGDNVEFIDDTNDPYNLPIRTFHSFLGASEEAGLSRLYGGIHYHHSCEVGRKQGLEIGSYVTQKVVTFKASK
jgi:hypothetical protein